MITRIGFACQVVGIPASTKTFKKATFEKKGNLIAEKTIIYNLQQLEIIFNYMKSRNLNFFRISGDVLPWKSEYSLEDLPLSKEIFELFEKLSNFLKINDFRITTHPGQFNVLCSENPQAIHNTIKDLTVHGELLDFLGMPQTTWSKINIHLSGKSTNQFDSFKKNYLKLPDAVKTRLTIENDDTPNGKKVENLVPYSNLYGIPIVYDFYHNTLNPSSLNNDELYKTILQSWDGIVPVMHWSESLAVESGISKISKIPKKAHSNICAGILPEVPFDYHLMVEAKQKDLSFEHLLDYDKAKVIDKLGITAGKPKTRHRV